MVPWWKGAPLQWYAQRGRPRDVSRKQISGLAHHQHTKHTRRLLTGTPTGENRCHNRRPCVLQGYRTTGIACSSPPDPPAHAATSDRTNSGTTNRVLVLRKALTPLRSKVKTLRHRHVIRRKADPESDSWLPREIPPLDPEGQVRSDPGQPTLASTCYPGKPREDARGRLGQAQRVESPLANNGNNAEERETLRAPCAVPGPVASSLSRVPHPPDGARVFLAAESEEGLYHQRARTRARASSPIPAAVGRQCQRTPTEGRGGSVPANSASDLRDAFGVPRAVLDASAITCSSPG